MGSKAFEVDPSGFEPFTFSGPPFSVTKPVSLGSRFESSAAGFGGSEPVVVAGQTISIPESPGVRRTRVTRWKDLRVVARANHVEVVQ